MASSRGAGKRPRGRFERFLFSFMGPAQIGDANGPVPDVERPVQVCQACGRSYDEHEVVRTPAHSYTRCPAD